jgi:UPF0755 protein
MSGPGHGRTIGDDGPMDPTDPPNAGSATGPGPTFRPRPRRRRRWVPLVGVLAAVVAVVLVVSGVWVWRTMNPSGPKDAVEFTIPVGATTTDVSERLVAAGVVSDAAMFRTLVRVRGGGPFEAGRYEGLTTNQSMSSAIDVLADGPAPPKTVFLTIPEGLWLPEIRQRALDAFPEMTPEAWDQAVATVTSRYQPAGATLEGLLFPATYEVLVEDQGDATKLVRQMVDTFERVADEVGLDAGVAALSAAAGQAITPYEAITIASLIEGETAIDEERPKVAQVVANRLVEGMRLDIDATVIYALGRRTPTLTFDDLQVDSPWNTRRFGGIPPSPIGAPGRAALAAAVAPEPGPWLYYVLVDPAGYHLFTDDYQEFLAAAEDARRRGVFE